MKGSGCSSVVGHLPCIPRALGSLKLGLKEGRAVLIKKLINTKTPNSGKGTCYFFLTKAPTRILKTKAHSSLLPPAGVEIGCSSHPESTLNANGNKRIPKALCLKRGGFMVESCQPPHPTGNTCQALWSSLLSIKRDKWR